MDASSDERRDAGRLLAGLEAGTLSAADARVLAEKLDPVLVYAIVSFLREVYPASDPAASSVLERVVGLTSASPALVKKYREGGQDPIARWLESEHPYRDFRGRGADLLALVAEKLDT